jgi:hypothetical protein
MPHFAALRSTTMATVMVMHWPGLTTKDYDSVRNEVKWETNTPAGGKYHVAWAAGDGIHVVDVWESGQRFEQFLQGRLMPAVQKLKIPGQPKVDLFEAHATFAPNP